MIAHGWRRPLLVVLITVAGVAGIFRWHTSDLDRMFDTDEADYVRAMRHGFWANYLGTSERSGFRFASDVFDEYRRTGWARPFQHDWENDDAAGLRHYHPPVPFYPVSVAAAVGGEGEAGLRLGFLVVGVLACVAAALLAYALLGGIAPAVRVWMALAAGLLAATSPYHIGLSTSVSPHAAFSLASAVALAGLTLTVRSGRLRWWLAAWSALGVSILTLPYWALLVPAFLWAWWWGLPGRAPRGPWLLRGLLAATVTTLVVWPPFLLSAGFVKPALMYAGIIVRPLVEGRTPGAWVLDLVQTHWLAIGMLLVGLFAAPFASRVPWRSFVPSVVFLAGFLILNLRVGHMKDLYVADAIVPLSAVAVALVGWSLQASRRGSLFAAGAAALVALVSMPVLIRGTSHAAWRPAMDQLNAELAGQRVLVTPRPAGAMVKYYLPDAEVVLDSNHPDDVAGLKAAMNAAEIDGVLRWGSSTEPGGAAAGRIRDRQPSGDAVIQNTGVAWWFLR